MKGSVAANANGAGRPTVTIDNGIQLSGAFVVSGTKTGTFYLDAMGQVDTDSGNTHCELNAPEFGFR